MPYEKRFAMPGNGNGNYYYSFDHGNIHFLVFSTETNFTTGSTQVRTRAAPWTEITRKGGGEGMSDQVQVSPCFPLADSAHDPSRLPIRPQWNWMNADLAAVDRTLTPFVIVGASRCGYPKRGWRGSHFHSGVDND